MFTKMTVGKRISLGFALILLLAVALGSMAIYEMRNISQLSNKLAVDYAPEVDIVGSLERNSRRVMYEMRGYGFTEDEKFFKQAGPWRETLQKRIDAAEKLAAQTKVLVKLAPAMKLFKEEVSKYDKLMIDTKERIEKLASLRTGMDKSAAAYLQSTGNYLKNQNKQMDNEFKNTSLSIGKRQERLEKISSINDAIDVTNNIRVKNFKAQTLRDLKIYQEAIKDFSKILPIEKRLRAITYKAADKRTLKAMTDAKKSYKEAMIAFLEEWKALQKIGVQRNYIGGEVVKKAEEVSRAGIAGTKKIANAAMNTASRANSVMIIGLLITVLLGIILSYVLVKAITGAITKITDGLRESSTEVSTASGQLSQAGQELSSSANEQASSIEETSSSLEELTGMVNNNVDNAKKCVDISQTVSDSSQKGNSSMQELIGSMQNILKSNEKIQKLVSVIGEIGEKTLVIDEIVFQTKLLSFNASVEAERAGEHGRGFAVVAQEVGNLAQMSGKAATEISTIVKKSIKNAEEITTENKQKVEYGNDIVKSSAEILREISEKSNVLLENVNSILRASQDQASGISQINNAVIQLDKATQENAATAEETASSSEELSAQAENLNGMVRELTAIVTGNVDGHSSQVLVQKGFNKKEFRKSNVVHMSNKIKTSAKDETKNHAKCQIADKAEEQNQWEAI